MAETPLTDSTSDSQLLAAARGGALPAFEMLVQRYQNDLYRFLHRFCNDRAMAEDLFQETFLQVYQSMESFDVERNFKPWLFTIAANKARDYLRRHARRSTAALSSPVDSSDDQSQSFLDLMDAQVALPVDDAINNETREQVQRIVQGLPDHLREVLILAYFQQLPYKDIAKMLAVPLGTVKSRLHAAVGTFASEWKRQNPPSTTA